MKRLTINQIARANLRHNRRAYLSMAIGIFMAVFLAASLCLGVQGVVARRAEDSAEKFGRMDVFTINANNMSDAEMLETGLFRPGIGHIYVTAEIPELSIAIGSYDETAVELMNRTLTEGRMPETPGEIALEQSALDRLRTESILGDAITLTVIPLDGLPEERTYTIVGIMSEQTLYLDVSTHTSFGSGTGLWPAILTCAEEPGFASGNVTIHRLFTLRPWVSRLQALSAFQYDGPYASQHIWSVNERGQVWDDPFFFMPHVALEENTMVLLLCMLGGALLIAVCAGISGAMESQLARKTEEIGMLRAVGATKRQIRRVFGRESWLIALIVAPAAILLACLMVWALSLVAPKYLLFRPSLWVLLPVLLLVIAVILMSSSLPLRRASRIMPMSVLRDTAILRKARRIKPRKRFKVSALVSRRMLTLHPGRLIGSVLLVAAMLVMSGFGAVVMSQEAFNYLSDNPEFRLGTSSRYGVIPTYAFASIVTPETLNESDLNQLAALPMVSKVLPSREIPICFELDEVGDYFSASYSVGDNQHLASERVRELYTENMERQAASMGITLQDQVEANERLQMDHRAAQAALGTEKTLVKMDLVVLDVDLEELKPYIEAGRVDIDAINAGREVVVYAPTYYLTQLADGSLTNSTWNGENALLTFPNDSLTVGQTLPIAQFYETDEERIFTYPYTQEDFEHLYQTTNLRRATVTIGALMGNDAGYPGFSLPFDACLITSEQGLRAMGLKVDNPWEVSVYLSGTPDAETEAWLESRITSIASRGGMPVTNYLERNRQEEAQRMQITVVFLCIAAVFFSAAAGLICGNVSRRIRADSRMIGTLRAVGADDLALIGCYSGSIFISVALGTLIAVGILFCMVFIAQLLPVIYGGWKAFVPILFLAALLLGCCLWVLRLRVKDVIKKSIVENIKEL